MTITNEDELNGLKKIGRIVANAMHRKAKAMEPGMTTRELDDIRRALLDLEGAVSAPEAVYDFPGERVIQVGDLVNIDVSASKNGFFADNGATFCVGPVKPSLHRLCKDGKRAMEIGIKQVGSHRPLEGIGRAVGKFASDRGYTLIRSFASHGVGRSLHEYPSEIATWPTRGDKRRMNKGLDLTIEPFLSSGGLWATEREDEWTLYSEPAAPVVQYEHTVVATDRGPIVVKLPG